MRPWRRYGFQWAAYSGGGRMPKPHRARLEAGGVQGRLRRRYFRSCSMAAVCGGSFNLRRTK